MHFGPTFALGMVEIAQLQTDPAIIYWTASPSREDFSFDVFKEVGI